MENERIARALARAGAVKFARDVPFLLVSRKIAPVYIDVRQLTAAPEDWREAVAALVGTIRAIGEEDMVSGGELADLFFSVPVALELRKPHLTIRKAPKGHGIGGRLVGAISKGQRTVHVSDLITSGTSALDWIGVVNESGGRIAKYVTVFDRNQGGREALAGQGVEFHSLLTLDDEFLRYASESGAIGRDESDSIMRYIADPEGWARDFLLEKPSFLTDRINAVGGKLVRSDGLEVLLKGYPELVPDLGDAVRRKMRELGVDDAVVR